MTSSQSSLTDQQCAEIQAWAQGITAKTGREPAIVVDRDKEPGAPMFHAGELVVHPEDYLALQRWGDRQLPLRWFA
jgi:hypothetical protein